MAGLQNEHRNILPAISCADAHPVHDYEIREDGSFWGIGGPAESFDIKVERAALMSEFYSRGKWKVSQRGRDLDSDESLEVLARFKTACIANASDKYLDYYLKGRELLVVSLRRKHWALRESASAEVR